MNPKLMKLSLVKPYLSITSLEANDLPEFVVLTGKNGSGKSHLLRAIKAGDIHIEGIDKEDVNLLDLQSFKVSSQAASSRRELENVRNQAFNVFQPQGALGKNGLSKGELGDYLDCWSEISPENRSTLEMWIKNSGVSLWDILDNPATEASPVKKDLRNSLNWMKNALLRIGRNRMEHPYPIIELQGTYAGPLTELSRDEFERRMRASSDGNSVLSHKISELFVDYFDRRDTQKYREFQNNEYGADFDYYTEKEFVRKFGPPPWEIVNAIMKEIGGLDYSFTFPKSLNENEKFSTQLKRETDALEIDIEELSSGEQAILALVVSVFTYKTNSQFPKVVLLDEVDASLHPSMAKVFLDTIQSVLVASGVKVILVTHSPTTVALAPEKTIYSLNQDPQKRVSKISRSEAINVLTDGFATLEQGLNLFDEVIGDSISIITEGNNTKYIQQFIRHRRIEGVKVITGIENSSGKRQLKTLYDFFCKSNTKAKVVFVWDCDCNEFRNLTRENGIIPFVFKNNEDNSFTSKGIENLFSEELFDEDLLSSSPLPNGPRRKTLAGNMKNIFLERITVRNNPQDFENFKELEDVIRGLKME